MTFKLKDLLPKPVKTIVITRYIIILFQELVVKEKKFKNIQKEKERVTLGMLWHSE